MELIKPNEIGVKISTLISEASEKFYAITPYVNISDWKKIIVSIEHAKKRNVSIKFYIREINEENFKILTSLGVQLFKIKNLHTKLYFNENELIVSSMNLYEFSDLHSIDIAILYRDRESYIKFYDYFLKYINPIQQVKYCSPNSQTELIEIKEYLTSIFPNSRINLSSDYLLSSLLIKKFDLFIRTNEITLKLRNKNASESEFDNITNEINKKVHNDVIANKPSGNYMYYTWDIKLVGYNTPLEIANLVRILNDE
ncbi:MAG: hypothetical protein DI598_14300 [Pseudopedobacter saltans]|uniref:Phospholipase D-like domain-containing protein n=1 Tax=Pseudopedobacter saltans TaxID=151895 RepID=A0A2W5GFW3_9SPHI|nr:MAG: hypothetical protein DI598_14300 [Pseudopedobacter saltans]